MHLVTRSFIAVALMIAILGVPPARADLANGWFADGLDHWTSLGSPVVLSSGGSNPATASGHSQVLVSSPEQPNSPAEDYTDLVTIELAFDLASLPDDSRGEARRCIRHSLPGTNR